MQRNRWIYAGLAVAVIGLALGLRFGYVLPAMAGKYTGDALYALMAFCWIGALLPRAATAVVARFALGVCFAIEFSQLVHFGWLDWVRATTLGHLVLGARFGWWDLVAFIPGVTVAALAEGIALSPARH
jgi:integral membrane sensor domain MASE1